MQSVDCSKIALVIYTLLNLTTCKSVRETIHSDLVICEIFFLYPTAYRASRLHFSFRKVRG